MNWICLRGQIFSVESIQPEKYYYILITYSLWAGTFDRESKINLWPLTKSNVVNTFSERCEVSDFEKSITQINADDKHYFVFIMSHLSTPNTRTDVNSSMSAWSLKSYINLTFSKIYEEKKESNGQVARTPTTCWMQINCKMNTCVSFQTDGSRLYRNRNLISPSNIFISSRITPAVLERKKSKERLFGSFSVGQNKFGHKIDKSPGNAYLSYFPNYSSNSVILILFI